MPIYEYKCDSCQKVHEVIQKFSDEPLKQCPQCQGEVTKLISNTSFVLKGSGWYADGYSSAGKGAKPEASSSPSCPAAPKSDAKTEAPKPAPSSEKKEATA